ncbi:hypothetical protein [uncultured Microbacterium sp.]|uniref:hypothetical protein n=1 Tax=uncultured Microbacterium sp. TaxID=191216 RepID=UPI0035CBF211
MNTDDNINENINEDSAGDATGRPLGYWLRLVERQIAEAFAAEFEADGFDRREWMALNLLSGEVGDERFARIAERIAERAGKHGGKLFRTLAEQGLVTETDGVWTLTDEGRAKRAAMKGRVDAIRERVTAAVSPEDYATTVASLEAIARALGWDGSERMPRGFGRGRAGFGPGFGRGFGHRGFGPGAGFGPGFGRPDFGHGHPGCGPEAHDERGQHRHPHHGARDGRKGERAFERGFEAGFAAASRVTSQS